MAKQPAKKPAPKKAPAKPAAKISAAKKPAPKKPVAKKPTAAKKAVSKAPATRKPTAPKVKLVAAGSLAIPEGSSKFTLFNLLGEPRAYYVVDRTELDRGKPDPKAKTIAHSIIVVDRSGSMYGQMRDVRETLLKLLTLDEYKQYSLVVTLISYSSVGDVTCHFQRVPISQIMKPGSEEQRQIQRLDATCLTCISGGLKLAESLVKDGELTSITLHSDGYANDPSSNAEATNLMAICKSLQGKDVFVNTIAYTDYSDFRLLSRVANGVGGSCVKAGNIKIMYDTLYENTKTLGSSLVPPVEVPLPKDAEYQVFVSHAAKRVNGAAGELKVMGVRPEQDAAVYQYRKVSEKEYKALKDVPEMQTSEAVYAFAKGQLAEGNLNTAKYAVASAFDATMVMTHGKALTNNQTAALATDLDKLLADPGELDGHQILSEVPVNKRIPFVRLVNLLEDHPDDYLVNLPYLQEHYVRRGVKRLQGTRDENGNLMEPWLKTEYADKDEYVRVSRYEVNQNAATMNMLISRRVKLVKAKGGEVIEQVAGVKLDQLRTFNNYTLVGDGELNVQNLKLRITGKKLFDALVKEGVLENEDGTPAGKHDPKAAYILRLDVLPLVPPFSGEIKLTGVFDELCGLKILASLCGAHLKEAAEDFTPEQVEELKKHYLSKSLYLNFPTTNPYTDRLKALSEGTIDTRTSYKIDIGNKDILNLSKLHSANKFLERMYVPTVNGTEVEKPKFEDALDGTWKYGFKTLSARVKVTKVDDLMKEYFDEFLGLKATGVTIKTLESVGAKDLAKIVQDRLKGKQPEKKAFVAALTDARKKLEARQEELFRDRLSALVFYIGSTGLLPDELDVKAQTADQISNKYPDLALSKDEREGTFFEIGDTILTVYAKTEDFSREVVKM
jgi:Mg-chelatase subunit ChlD